MTETDFGLPVALEVLSAAGEWMGLPHDGWLLRVYEMGMVPPLATFEYDDYESAQIAAERVCQVGFWWGDTYYPVHRINRCQIVANVATTLTDEDTFTGGDMNTTFEGEGTA